MNKVARAILAFLANGPKGWQEVHAHVCQLRIGYVAGDRHFMNRLERLVKRGALAKLLVKGRNLYLLPDALKGLSGADLGDSAERQMAADLLEEQGDEATAKVLRSARRFQRGKGQVPPAEGAARNPRRSAVTERPSGGR
jgi:hypothetical protein